MHDAAHGQNARRRPHPFGSRVPIQVNPVWDYRNIHVRIEAPRQFPQTSTVRHERRCPAPNDVQEWHGDPVVQPEVVRPKSGHIAASKRDHVGNAVQPVQEPGNGARWQSEESQHDVRSETAASARGIGRMPRP